MKAETLEYKLRQVMGEYSQGLSEREALEAALNVAEEWKMRLAEIEEEEAE